MSYPRRKMVGVRWVVLGSPIGDLGVAVEAGTVVGVSFGRPKSIAEIVGADLAADPVAGDRAVLVQVRDELSAYFAGERVIFDVPNAARRGSAFERAVWAQIAEVPYGETTSYGAIARAVGEPGGAQAV